MLVIMYFFEVLIPVVYYSQVVAYDNDEKPWQRKMGAANHIYHGSTTLPRPRTKELG